MGLLRYIIQGFGHGLGRELAHDAYKEAKDKLPDPETRKRGLRGVVERVAEKQKEYAERAAANKEARERAAAQAAHKAKVDDTLDQLKKKVAADE